MKRFILITGVIIATLFLANPAAAAEIKPMPQGGWWEVLVSGGHSLSCPLTVELWRNEHLIGAQNLAPFPASPPPVMMSLPPGPPLPIPEPLSLGKVHASYPLEIKFRPSGSCPSDLNFVNENNAVFAEILPILDGSGEQLIGWLAGWAGLEPFWLIELNLGIKPIDPPVNPAIFIHGLGGHWTDWTMGNKKMYWERLDKLGYPPSYRASYAYADYNNDGQYDYQGDIREIENNLPSLVNQLADEYSADGGDCSNGCVDLVGFSLGGMVAREYLNEHWWQSPSDHKIRKLVTIGSPHRGAFVLHLKGWVDNLGLTNTAVGDALIENVDYFINSFRETDQPISVDSPAIQQIIPTSDYLASLNTSSVNSEEVHLIFSKIGARLHQQVFFFDLTKELPIGDGLITEASATGAPFENKQAYGFSDQRMIDFQLELTREEQSFSLEIGPGPGKITEYRFWHENMVRQPEVVDTVFSVLQN